MNSLTNIESNKNRLRELTSELINASQAYYNGREIMTDKQFDEKLKELAELEGELGIVLAGSPTHNVGAAVANNIPKFTHTYPAKSLDKTKDLDEFESKFIKGIEDSHEDNQKVVVMWKEDGATVQAYYKDGKLQVLATRGNGEVGGDITHNARCIEGLPIEIPFKEELVVRGEALMSYEEFQRINEELPDEDKYRNPRNLAAATLTMLDSEEASKRHIVLKAFNLVYIPTPIDSFSRRLSVLDELGFSTVEREVVDVSDLKSTMITKSDSVNDYPFPVDGLVVAMDNYAYSSKLEGTEHHPNIMQGYAFKWADESIETTIREIEWSPSRTGRLNPVAIFDPVVIDGTTVSRASLHNLSVMRGMRIHVGNRIGVYKSNMIIPYVDCNFDYDSAPEYDEDFIHDLIGFCPTCGAAAEVKISEAGIETVYCPNEECPEKTLGKLAHFCSRDCMDFQGMSEATLNTLMKAGVVTDYASLFNLDKFPSISMLPGFGKASWKKLVDAGNVAKKTTFVKFFSALGIPDIGKGQLKTLKQYMDNHYEALCELTKCDSTGYNLGILLSRLGHAGFDFSKIDGFGDVLSKNLSTWLQTRFDMLGEWTPELEVYSLVTFEDSSSAKSDTPIYEKIHGKSFCITGKLVNFHNRQALIDKIEEAGGRWVDSVSSKTDYLINNDIESTTGKNKKAKELNIPIITEGQFLDMLGQA